MNWLHYLLEANIYLAVFYAVYCLLLNKETYYTLNRVYLLFSCIISFMLPVLQIGALKTVDTGITSVILLPPIQQHNAIAPQPVQSHLSMQDILFYAYLTGVAVLAIVLLVKLFRLSVMTKATNKVVDDKYKMISIEGSNTAFSFFNYLFIGTKTAGTDIIIKHELVHIRQKHSADIVFLELIKIINWFNPFIYLLQMSLKTVHEYIADEQTAALEPDTLAYSSFLVNNAYGLNGSSITHSFFNYNLLKKRIIMLHQKRSGNLARLKYLITVPICAGLLCASTLGFSKSYGLVDLLPHHELAVNPADTVLADTFKIGKAPKAKYYPPPVVVKNGYSDLMNYAYKTIKYPESAASKNKPGLVKVSFLLNNNHVSDVNIINGSGNEFEATVLKALKAYTGNVTDKPGRHTVMVCFFTDYYAQAPRYATNINNNGYDLNIAIVSGLGTTPPPAPKFSTKMPPPPPPAEPKGKGKVKVTDVKLLPPPAPRPQVHVKMPAPPAPDLSGFYKYVAKHVRYPTKDHDDHVAGRVIVSFDVADGKIKDPQLKRSLTDATDNEVLRVVQSFDEKLNLKPGNYTLFVAFTLLDKKSNAVGHLPETVPPVKNNTNENNTFSTSVGLNEVAVVSYVDK